MTDRRAALDEVHQSMHEEYHGTMRREDIIRMARKAGWSGIYTKPLFSITMQEDDFLRFAALVAAAEREACAKVCEDIPLPKNPPELTHLPTIERCAAAIRARGQ